MIKENKHDWGMYLVFILFTLAIFLFLREVVVSTYCDYNPSPLLDSPCFDVDLRCTIECDNYGLNYTGFVDRCNCLCNDDSEVSYCSGARYVK